MALTFRSLLVLMSLVATLLALVLLGPTLLAPPVQADTISGTARVVDGDTLDFAGQKVRLHGVDAPELAQTCTTAGQDWPCGTFARDLLARLVGQARLRCEVQDTDRYGRAVAICRDGTRDINATLVRAGGAVAYLRYSDRYLADEQAARAAGAGIWSGTMQSPEAWRRTGDPAPQAAPEGCVIKGNIGSSGKIYHLPGQADYAATRIDPKKGEAWFCSEADARAAGFRPARR
jgi:endonuclease YncB( thermonuclease family)